jgi:predicted short-subunit dehydrogenase-like oxidoreductase (DUF2520 family)
MSSINSKRFEIVFIGAGNVAHSLAMGMHSAGHRIVQVIGQSKANASELALKVFGKSSLSLADIYLGADIYIIATPDNAIADISINLPNLNGIVVHTSGSTSMDTIKGASENYGVLYPFQTFTRGRDIKLNEVPFCIEASNDEVYNCLFQLANSVGAKPVKMDSEARAWLHVTGVFSCNFVNHMLAIAEATAKRNGLSFDLLKPLVAETIDKALKSSPSVCQTGPAIRGDSQTIMKHIEMLNNIDTQTANLYQEITQSIIKGV